MVAEVASTGSGKRQSSARTPRREPRVPADTHYRLEIAGTPVEILDVRLYPPKKRGMVGEIRTKFGPLDVTFRVVRADGDPFIAAPSHTVRAYNGQTRYLHRVRVRDDAEADRFNAFLMAAYEAAVDEWGHPNGKTVRPKPHRVHELLDRVVHIKDTEKASTVLLEGLQQLILGGTATDAERLSASRLLGKVLDREVKKFEHLTAAIKATEELPDSERMREAAETEWGLLNGEQRHE